MSSSTEIERVIKGFYCIRECTVSSRACCPASIAEAATVVLCHVVKSLQLI